MRPARSQLVLTTLLTLGLVCGAGAAASAEIPLEPEVVNPSTSMSLEPEADDAEPSEEPVTEVPVKEETAAEETAEDSVEVSPQLAEAPVDEIDSTPSEQVTTEEPLLTAALRTDTRNTRISGDNRYKTAVAVSQHGFPGVAGTVIVANGDNYPDSLSAAPVAAKLNAPLLLTNQAMLPADISEEIKRLKPTRIIIAGGDASVSAQVESELRALLRLNAPSADVERAWGENRYSTSVALAKKGWPTNGSTKTAFIATGTDFADALAAGPAAKQRDAPVLLVPGPLTSAPAETLAELKRHGATQLYVAGGTASVSDSMVSSLQAHTSGLNVSVEHHAGTGRFDTAALIALEHFGTNVPSTYWASGFSFADALSGAAVAGKNNSPLLLSQPACIPTATYDANDSRRPERTYLLGGPAALNDPVLRGDECMSAAPSMTAQDLSGSLQVYSLINQTRYNANLQGARLADVTKNGYSANSWTLDMIASNTLKLNPTISTQYPWVAYEYVLKNPLKTHASPQAAFDKMYGDDLDRQAVLYSSKPAGARMLVSISWMHRGATSWMTVHSGS